MTVTREEARQDFQRAVEAWERRAKFFAGLAAHGDISEHGAHDHARHQIAIYRLALAALDDGERYEKLLERCRELDVAQRSGDVYKAQRALLNWRKALVAIDAARQGEPRP